VFEDEIKEPTFTELSEEKAIVRVEVSAEECRI
jgi:hypothetical protein